MKIFKCSFLALSLISSVASAKPNFWINGPEKTVVVAANPTLLVNVYKLEVSNEYYARMDVSLNYIGADMVSQIKEITSDYTDYKVQKVVLEKHGLYHLQIDALGVDENVEPKPGVEGPYIEDQVYLSRAKYKAVMDEMKAGHQLVQVSGAVSGTVPMMKVVERKEVDNSICEKLIGDDRTLGSTLSNMASVSRSALSAIQFQYESTRDSIIRDVKENCFEVTPTGRIDSFADILAVHLTAKKLDRKIFGETLQKSYEKQEIPLSFETHQSGGAK